MENIFFMICILMTFVSCGSGNSSKINSGNSGIVGSGALKSIELKIRTSSSGLKWKESYSEALLEIFSEVATDSLFTTVINQGDLDLVGCSSFNNFTVEEKKMFYIAFIAAIAEAESDYEVAQRTYNKADGTMNVGLLQIDPASAKRHTSEALNRSFNEEDLKNPALNLKVGALVLKNQIGGKVAHGRLFPTSTYYWQVLSGAKKRFMKNISINLQGHTACSV